jgi:hypothetical protein
MHPKEPSLPKRSTLWTLAATSALALMLAACGEQEADQGNAEPEPEAPPPATGGTQ